MEKKSFVCLSSVIFWGTYYKQARLTSDIQDTQLHETVETIGIQQGSMMSILKDLFGMITSKK